MSAKNFNAISLVVLGLFNIPTAFAEEIQYSASAVIRGNYQYKEYATSDQSKLKFSDVRLDLAFNKDNLSGMLTARCYQFDELCDFSVLSDAYLKYKLDQQQQVSIGLQAIPFGIDTFWDSSFYESMMNSTGFQDIHNLGFRYDYANQQHQVNLAYFPVDGGRYIGDSKDAARYSANYINGQSAESTQLEEKNMLIARYAYQNQYKDVSYVLGVSAWYSQLEHLNDHQTGDRKNANIFAQLKKDQMDGTFTFGYQDVDNKVDGIQYSTLGSFDSEYQLANKAYYYVADLGYNINQDFYQITGLRPYLSSSGLLKKQHMPDSYRNIMGMQFDYKKLRVNAEYILAKNDAVIGGSADAFAHSSDRDWKQLFYMTLGYRF